MTSRSERDKAKQLQDKCQSVLNELLRDEDNKYCVDCDSKGPRWASWNLGVFLCIRCAGIHRNLGVHISKVKSVNLDSWTPEQVVSLQQMGNSRARAVYEANLPDNFRRPQNDSSLESFIRAKYEHKKYIAREWIPPQPPKVDWEKEIEEEMEKQRRKKKTTSIGGVGGLVVEKKVLEVGSHEVPQLPKPTNPSPKSGRSGSKEAKARKESDLLGLQQNGTAEDSTAFTNFVSAPPSSTKTETKLADDEESFFNQTLPTTVKEKVKLDKDSILALYAHAPTPSNLYGKFAQVPGVGAPPPFPAAFGGYPQAAAVYQGVPQQHQWQTTTGQSQQYVPVVPAAAPGQLGLGYAPAQTFGQFPVGAGFPQQVIPAPVQYPAGPPQLFAPVAAQTQNLPHQFAALTLNNPQQTTTTTNIWQ